MSISAQSCDSVPPAPGLIVTSALRWASSPRNMFRDSRRAASISARSSPRLEFRLQLGVVLLFEQQRHLEHVVHAGGAVAPMGASSS